MPISTNTSWPAEKKYKIIRENTGELILQRTLSHMSWAHMDAEPLMEKCKKGDVILINWYAHYRYYYPNWLNLLYEPHIIVTYCYLRKQEEDIFYEYTVSDQEYDTIKPIWKYSVTPLPSKSDMLESDNYLVPRFLLRWITIAALFLLTLRLTSK
jgi:hypothetical protein